MTAEAESFKLARWERRPNEYSRDLKLTDAMIVMLRSMKNIDGLHNPRRFGGTASVGLALGNRGLVRCQYSMAGTYVFSLTDEGQHAARFVGFEKKKSRKP